MDLGLERTLSDGVDGFIGPLSKSVFVPSLLLGGKTERMPPEMAVLFHCLSCAKRLSILAALVCFGLIPDSKAVGKGLECQANPVASSSFEAYFAAKDAVVHHDQTWDAIKQAAWEALQEYRQSKAGCTDPCQAFEMEGKLLSELATLVGGPAALGKLSELAKLGKLKGLLNGRLAKGLGKLDDEAFLAAKLT